MNKTETIEYINSLKNFSGYVQFSHRAINKSKDIFINDDIKIENEDGFIYEAHFSNGKQSIQIRQINDSWLVSETDISNVDKNGVEAYITDIENLPNIKMAQIWEEREDKFCENIKVKKLLKVVFAGFEGDIK